MPLRNYELDQKVTLREVYEALNKHQPGGAFATHDVDLGDFGIHEIDCDNEGVGIDPDEFVKELLYGKHSAHR